MSPLDVGSVAPDVPGVPFETDPTGLFFYKVTCPTCAMAAPTMRAFEQAYPGRVVGVGQDPLDALTRFSAEHDMRIRSVEDAPPYPVSDAYRIVSVPTLFLVGSDGRIAESVGAWDRDGFNRVAVAIASSTGRPAVQISSPEDGLPAFKPG